MSTVRLVYSLIGGAGFGAFLAGLWAVSPWGPPRKQMTVDIVRPPEGDGPDVGGTTSGPQAEVDDADVERSSAEAVQAAEAAAEAAQHARVLANQAHLKAIAKSRPKLKMPPAED